MKKIIIIISLLPAMGLISYGQSSTSPVSASKQQPTIQTASPVVTVKGSSVDPVTKPVPVAKAQEPAVNSTNSGLKITMQPKKETLPDQSYSSTSDKPVSSFVQPVDAKQVKHVQAETQVKEVLPAVLKGSSVDPDAKPVMQAEKTIPVTAPVQNSGSSVPAGSTKPVKVEKTKTN